MSDENREKALNYHSQPTPGKLRIEATKPMTSHHDLTLAYSPGVAYPCLEIEKDPLAAREYTSRANLVGVMTRRANGAGALVGAITGAAVMFCLWRFTRVNAYLYTVTGITSCFAAGYAASLVLPGRKQDLSGLTVYTMQDWK